MSGTADQSPYRVAIIGAGGVGGYFGGRLAQAGIDTTFIVRGATLEALRGRGLRVDSIAGDFALERVQATDDPADIGVVDAIVMTVKTWQIPEAAAKLRPLIGPDTIVVPLENGIDAPDVLAELVGREHVLGGLCGIVSFVVAPGHVRHVAAEPFVKFGELDNRASERAERLRAAFERAGVKADIPESIQQWMWMKFLFIVPMSAIGALTRVPIGVWRAMPEPRAMAEDALREIIALATARGVMLPPNALALTMERYDAMPPESTSSLQRDVIEGKPSELEAQLGAVVRLGAASGVATPVSSILYACLVPQERRARGV
ncbi:MAG TPA: 2-dehydropantoate 2-reductase [Thermoanaerobaculia bacterium]|jgi:2-dehydropantoate 2-reductase